MADFAHDDDDDDFEFDLGNLPDWDDETATMELVDGSTTVVSARLRPLLMEWDWTRDPQKGTVVRTTDARPLFDEHVRLGTRFESMIEHPAIDRAMIRALFGRQRSYQSLLETSVRAREHALHEFGIILPAVSDVIVDALYAVLSAYYRWRHKQVRWVFTPDPDNLTPGQLVQEVGVVAYDTLGKWMDKEFNGSWAKSPKAPTGMKPMTYGQAMQTLLRALWQDRIEYENVDEEIDFEEFERDMKDLGYPIDTLLRYALRVVRSYQPG